MYRGGFFMTFDLVDHQIGNTLNFTTKKALKI